MFLAREDEARTCLHPSRVAPAAAAPATRDRSPRRPTSQGAASSSRRSRSAGAGMLARLALRRRWRRAGASTAALLPCVAPMPSATRTSHRAPARLDPHHGRARRLLVHDRQLSTTRSPPSLARSTARSTASPSTRTPRARLRRSLPIPGGSRSSRHRTRTRRTSSSKGAGRAPRTRAAPTPAAGAPLPDIEGSSPPSRPGSPPTGPIRRRPERVAAGGPHSPPTRPSWTRSVPSSVPRWRPSRR